MAEEENDEMIPACIEACGVNLPDVTDNLEDILVISLMVPMGDPNDADCPWGLPIILWGLSGIAKSAKVKQACKRLGLKLCEVFPSQLSPENFSDLPVVMDEDGKGDKLRSACFLTQINEANQAKDALIFWDEASLAPPTTQGAMLSVLLLRKAGSTELGVHVRQMLAANPPKYAAGGFSFEAAFANRIVHFFVQRPSVRSLGRYYMSGGNALSVDNIEQPMAKVRANFHTHFSELAGQLIGFYEAREDLIHQQPEPDDPNAGYAWNSPRSWDMAIRAVATCRSLDMSDQYEQSFIEAAVGEGPAAEFIEYMAKADLPKPLDHLEKGWDIDKRRLDRTWAAFTGMTAFVANYREDAKQQVEYARMAWIRLKELCEAGFPDIATGATEVLMEANLGRRNKLATADMKEACQDVLYILGEGGHTKYAQTAAP